jgi:hypothetical protein
MANELIRPIDADTAHAIEETAKATAKGIDAATQGGQYVGSVLGDLPHDLVGIMGDWVKHKRARRWAELSAETERILRARGVENREEVSPSVAIPLIAAALNEDREVLKDLWAKLLANAMDPKHTNLVRPSLIELLKQFDPLDALVLRELTDGGFQTGSNLAQGLAAHLKVLPDEAYLSLEHLFELRCLGALPNDTSRPPVTSKGRALIRAVSD